jgi:hypothetical protein
MHLYLQSTPEIIVQRLASELAWLYLWKFVEFVSILGYLYVDSLMFYMYVSQFFFSLYSSINYNYYYLYP